jgi:hypothetical protein
MWRGRTASPPAPLTIGRIYNNYLCTYDLYGPVHKVSDAGRYFRWGSGVGWGGGGFALEISSFVGPCEHARAEFIDRVFATQDSKL